MREGTGEEHRVITEQDEKFFGEDHVSVIEPRTSWRLPNFRELWAYRELFFTLGARDVKVRYKQTVLGAAWAVIQPVAQMLLFTVIFGRFAQIPSEGYPYAVFVYSGLLPWALFASTVTAASGSLLGNAALITKVYFPRLLVPMTAVATPSVDFLVSAAVLIVLLFGYGVGLSPGIVLVPLLVIILAMLAVGIGTLLAASTVTYRDVRFVVPFLMQFWMFATPIIYPPTMIPTKYRWLLWLNPMSGIIDGFRAAFLGRDIHVLPLLVSFVFAFGALVLGVVVFQRVEERFADVI
jgi:lipopolysaccharide transport system permease protein